MSPRLSNRIALGLLLAAGLCLARPARAQERVSFAPDEPNVLLFDPGALVNGVASFEYERAMTDWFGLTGGVAITSFHGAFDPPGSATFVAFGPELGMRFHFIQSAPGGLWVGPYIGAVYVASRDARPPVRAFGYDLGAAAGYNFIFLRRLVVSVGAGGGLTDYGEGVTWQPRFRLGVGLDF